MTHSCIITSHVLGINRSPKLFMISRKHYNCAMIDSSNLSQLIRPLSCLTVQVTRFVANFQSNSAWKDRDESIRYGDRELGSLELDNRGDSLHFASWFRTIQRRKSFISRKHGGTMPGLIGKMDHKDGRRRTWESSKNARKWEKRIYTPIWRNSLRTSWSHSSRNCTIYLNGSIGDAIPTFTSYIDKCAFPGLPIMEFAGSGINVLALRFQAPSSFSFSCTSWLMKGKFVIKAPLRFVNQYHKSSKYV